MAVLPILLYGNEILRQTSSQVTEISNQDLNLIKNMFETMASSNGIGLAANQIGVLKQILVLDISSMEDGKNTLPMVVINPKIISAEGEIIFEEGCLSIPEIREDVLRAEKIELEYFDINLAKRNITAKGLLARVIMHEIDHLNGILFIDHVSKTRKTLIKSKLKRISKGEVIPNYLYKLK